MKFQPPSGNSRKIEGGYTDPEDGRVHGVKISACRACGHVREVSVPEGLCGRGSCIQKRKDKKKD